jgi:tRNA-dihydrouridine synthase 1
MGSSSATVVRDRDGKKKRKRKKKEYADGGEKKKRRTDTKLNNPSRRLNFDYKYILAPMVGASELAFRLLARKYGAQLAYTPMMSSTSFARDEEYRQQEFQTIPEDRPLVCHFSANNPEDFARAAQLCEPYCDAIDLNLGCPQRTAYVGHFGSYLLGKEDRDLVLSIVRAAVKAVSIPIFCKIRLLDTLEETVKLCRQLRDAGASLIAVHARYRASYERKGPSARDGPAMLDQVLELKKAIPDILIITNGNVVIYEDVVQNLSFTQADGVMSAEGILDNPALFLPRLGSREETDKSITIADPSPLPGDGLGRDKKERKLRKKLRVVSKIEEKIRIGGESSINDEQREKLARKSKIQAKLAKLAARQVKASVKSGGNDGPKTKTVSLGELYESADDKLKLAFEYLALVQKYPIKIRTVVFHTRRMLKDMLNQYQLMEECVACQTVDEVQRIIDRCRKYKEDPESFVYDIEKAKQQKEALERKKREEGKRKAFEARMVRKAKREGKDLEHYLRIGAEVPTLSTIQKLKSLQRDEQLRLWKQDHSQHCMAFHLDPEGCKRDRACAFLHTDAKDGNSFVESDEVAG